MASSEMRVNLSLLLSRKHKEFLSRAKRKLRLIEQQQKAAEMVAKAAESEAVAAAGELNISVQKTEKLQEREGILNSAFTLSVRLHQGTRMPPGKWLFNTLKWKVPHDHRGRSLWWIHRRTKRALGDRLGLMARWLGASTQRRGIYVVARAEQAPNPASRVVLSGKRDAFGSPQIALDWRFSDVDKRSLQVLMRTLDSELQRLSLGRAEPSPWLEEESVPWEMDPLISNHPVGGYHHMGTTRMATSPREGVVDENCRVHGLENLYVAGSSVFPTGGWANPTLTILALTLRLGDHLTRAVQAKRPPSPNLSCGS